jgi:hypothetical protein
MRTKGFEFLYFCLGSQVRTNRPDLEDEGFPFVRLQASKNGAEVAAGTLQHKLGDTPLARSERVQGRVRHGVEQT